MAGAAALVLQGNPTFTPAQVASAIVGGARRDVVTDDRHTPNRLLYISPAG